MTDTVTRFAPSPTGPLHLGHAHAALTARDLARAAGGRFLLRIEDIDRARCRPAWEAQIFDDLRWLGLDWPTPVLRQSARMDRYRAALDRLWSMGLLYPCTCRRRDIAAAAAAPQEGAPCHGPDGLVYPGTCRARHDRRGPVPTDAALRLDMARALDRLGTARIAYEERGPFAASLPSAWTRADIVAGIGDVVLARCDMGTSYHLSVVLDDHDQGVTLITRGVDLADATIIHVVLQKLMGLASAAYHHHALIRDAAGRRLAKRDDARSIASYRAAGHSPEGVRDLIGSNLKRTLAGETQASGPISSRSSPSPTDV